MEMLIFGHAGAKVLVFPTRCARFFEYEDSGLVNALTPKIEAGQLQLFCVDGIDAESLYAHWQAPARRMQRHADYERYLIDEVLPLLAWRNSSSCLIAHGCSLGAYHALNIACRHPGLFQKIVALSGRYDLTWSAEGFRNLLDGYYDDSVYFNTPSHFLRNLTDATILAQLRRIDIVLAVGHEDPFLTNNRQLSNTLAEKAVSHALHLWPGRAHSARAWREMVPLYL